MATKWNKADFMKAFHANSGTKHHNWVNFHAAMSRASKDAGAGDLEEGKLSARCGSINRFLAKAGYAKLTFPSRPASTKNNIPSVGDIAGLLGLAKAGVAVTLGAAQVVKNKVPPKQNQTLELD